MLIKRIKEMGISGGIMKGFNFFDQMQYLFNKQFNKKSRDVHGALVWLVTEIFQIIVCVLGSFFLLWMYAPFSLFVKAGISVLSLLVVYDVFKSFVWVRWILYKESLESD